MFTRDVTPGSTSRLTIVDHGETYGRWVLARAVRGKGPSVCVDLGCGEGADLQIVSRESPGCTLFGVDFSESRAGTLRGLGITPLRVDIERERLPLDDASVDFLIANQVMEHTKEVFWINHEIFRCLKVGGHFFMGVPNILSLHNWLLMALGRHPTQHKLLSAHVRPFSRRDVESFYREVAADFCELRGFWGSQFYPFPGFLGRPLARVFPGLAFSIFFLFQKTGEYRGEFTAWLDRAELETNFFRGR